MECTASHTKSCKMHHWTWLVVVVVAFSSLKAKFNRSILSRFCNLFEKMRLYFQLSITFSEYSMPMVDHAVASRTNIERLRQVYHQLYKYRDPSMHLTLLFYSIDLALVNMN